MEAKHDMDVDPYGTTMSGIKLLLREGMRRNGAMSETEYDILKQLDETIANIEDEKLAPMNP